MNGPTIIRILVIDDHPVLREGIAAMLEQEVDMEIVGTADDGAEGVAEFSRLRPDVTLMDLRMPGMDGLTAINAIRQEHPEARIIVLTTYEGHTQALNALRAGAAGFLLKSAVRKELVDTIHTVNAGRRYVPGDVAQTIALHAVEEPLSDRELEVLGRVAEGAANKEIAWALQISEDTVKAHMKSIFQKLNVRDRTQAVTTALRSGIIRL
ncbi:response regulator transcription factor [Sphingomonas sp. LB2R24]|uniref:response regulator transcription factor n=1 Tax=Sphingomonas sorbitolis TaxID=3096165 RepID=UPI002FC8A4D5